MSPSTVGRARHTPPPARDPGSLTPRVVALGAVAVLALLAVVFWAFHGSVTSIARGILASATWKLILIGLVVALVLLARSRRKLSALVVVLVILAAIPGAFLGGFTRQGALPGSVKTVEYDQPGYGWRLPWATAAASADSRAGDVVGDFDSADTTFLPAANSYATPVLARGSFVNGFNQVVIQSRTVATATVCTFAAQVPVHHGWYAYNLRRALSFVDPRLMAAGSDVWVYCDGKAAKLVIPVTKYAGFPEFHRLPAGCSSTTGRPSPTSGPSRPAHCPGRCTHSPSRPRSVIPPRPPTGSARVFHKAGFEAVEGGAANPDDGNVSEFLLNRTDSGEPIQAGTGVDGGPAAPSADLTALTNPELADLQAKVAAEVTNRLTAAK